MGASASQTQGPGYSFRPAKLRVVAARFERICQDFSRHFVVATQSVLPEARAYLCGLLMKAPRKNMERMEEYVAECTYENLQHFLSESPWDQRAFINHVAQEVNTHLGGPESVLAIDESAFEKKGDKSVGVGKQYNGRLGKVDNCQVGVFGALTNGQHAGLVDARLYLPQDWVDCPHRCREAGIPESEIVFKTKPQLALEIVDNAKANGLVFGWVTHDGLYGNNPEYLDALTRRGYRYVGAVHSNQAVFVEDPHPYLPRRHPPIHGRKFSRFRTDASSITVKELNASMDVPWNLIPIREGVKGIVSVYARRRRVWIWQEGEARALQVWLVIIKEPFTDELKYFLSNAGANVALKVLVQKAASRYFIERTFQDAKTSLGMADYQVRLWYGWQHHMAMVLLALLFMLKERLLNKDDMPLLSCQDLVELLNHFLPRGDRSEEEIFKQMERRHEKRQRDIEVAYDQQAKYHPELSVST